MEYFIIIWNFAALHLKGLKSAPENDSKKKK